MNFIHVRKTQYTRIPLVKMYEIVQGIEKNTQNWVITFNDIVNQPDKVLLNKSYMRENAFWIDPHNAKMFDFGQRIADLKEKLPENIKNLFVPSYSCPDEKAINKASIFLCSHNKTYNVLKELGDVLKAYHEYLKKSPSVKK